MYKLLKFYKEGFNPQQFWDARYAQSHIAGVSSDEFQKQHFWPLLEKYFKKGKTYLDIGCGVGGWILFLREQGYTVEGIDISRPAVQAITEYDPSVVVKVASMTTIPYSDASLDGALAIGTLEYVEDKVPQALGEVNRVLKSEGIFFMEVPIANAFRRIVYLPLKRIEKTIRMMKGQQPVFANYLFGRGELRKLMQDAGFEILEERPHELPDADSHYGLWIDWKILRGKEPYKLNGLGLVVKALANAISPWLASTGVIFVVRKK